jgi:hypothetical protein
MRLIERVGIRGALRIERVGTRLTVPLSIEGTSTRAYHF